MEKELIRFENVTSYDMLHSNVRNLSFVIYEGQMAGMVALNDTGCDVLLRLLQTNAMDITGKIYVRGKLVHNHDYRGFSKNNIAIIDHNNRLFKGLSTIDNIYLIPNPERHGLIISKKHQRRQFLWLKSELDLDLSINRNCEDISNVDRCIIEILRAVTAEAALIVLVGMSNFLTEREYKKIWYIIQKLRKKRQTFLMIGDNYSEIAKCADFTILLRDGTNIKLLTKEKHPDEMELLRCIEAGMNEQHKIQRIKCFKTNPVILEFRNVYTEEMKDVSFRLYEGQCLVLAANQRVQDDIISLLQKKTPAIWGEILFENKLLSSCHYKKLYPYGISFIVSNAYRRMPYMDLSYIENLTIGVERKSGQKIVRNNIQKLLRTEAKKELGDVVDNKNLLGLTKEELYRMLYSRILFIHPRLVVICSPFIESDYQTRIFITDLILQLRESGITILIMSTSLLKNTNLADKIIEIHHKKIYRIYTNDEFGA